MMKKTGLVITSVLFSALIRGAAGGAPQGLPKFPDPLQFILQRLVNPKQEMLGLGGGTHNLIHFACMDESHAVNGFLDSSSSTHREKEIRTKISNDQLEPSHTFSVGKGRFALFHEQGARHLILRVYNKGSVTLFEDRELQVEGLQDPAYGECPIVLSISHGALFKCWSAQSGIGKTLQVGSPSSVRTIHIPPVRTIHAPPAQAPGHAPNCCCADCVNKLAQMYQPSCPPAVPFVTPAQLSSSFPPR